LLASCFALPVAAQEKTDGPPAPEEVTFNTTDGVNIKGTFYKGDKGKDTVPIIMVHMYGRDRSDWHPLALRLQKEGHSVLTFDLRGHGESTKATVNGREIKLDYRDMKTAQAFRIMVLQDMEAAKQILMAKHNAGELNIDKLCVVGAELGAALAMNWAVLDWSWPVLLTGKQGQDVKALILLSPEWSFKGFGVVDALKFPPILQAISFQIVVGDRNSKQAVDNAERIYKLISPHRPEPKEPEDIKKYKNLWLDTYNTQLQGTKLLGQNLMLSGRTMEDRIAGFIRLRLVDQDIPWKERKTE